MIYFTWIITLCFAFFMGFFLHELMRILIQIKNRLDRLKTAPEAKEPDSIGTGEPLHPAQLAAMEDKERLKKLNPTLYE